MGLVEIMQGIADTARPRRPGAASRRNRTRCGLPHHGIWMVGAITGFASFAAFWLKTQMLIDLGKLYEAYILSTQLIRSVERDIPPEALRVAPPAQAG